MIKKRKQELFNKICIFVFNKYSNIRKYKKSLHINNKLYIITELMKNCDPSFCFER
jgi:hypothetical protein